MTTFDDSYETIFAYSFEATDTPARAFCRPGVERRCWSCGQPKGVKKFSSDAHVIPAMLGNTSLFSLEECDDCNNAHGKTLEQALSDRLTLWRAISRIRSRKGTFKHRTVPHLSYIEGNPAENRLLLEIYDDEDSLQLEDAGNGQLTLGTSVPPSNSVAACKGIARMAYFCMGEDDRAKNDHIRRWILGELDYLPVVFEAFLPGTGQRLVTLRLFRARAGSTGIAPYLVDFDYGSVVLLLPLPGADLHQPQATPLPEVPHSPYPPHVPTVTKITCVKDEKIPRHMEQIRIHYGSKLDMSQLGATEVGDILSRGAVLTMAATPIPPNSPVEVEAIDCPVKLLLINREGRVLDEANGALRSARWAAREVELTTSNPSIGWSLRFVVRYDGGGDVHFGWEDPCLLPIEAALRQLRLRKSAQSAKTIELRSFGSNAPLVWAQVESGSTGWDPSPPMIEVAERLALINGKTGMSLQLPRELNDHVAREIEWASSAVELGEFEGPAAESYDVPMNQLSIPFLERIFGNGGAPAHLMAPISDHLPILGQTLPTGQVSIVLEGPKVVGDLQAIIEGLRGLAPPHYANIKFTAAKAIFRFERFLHDRPSQ